MVCGCGMRSHNPKQYTVKYEIHGREYSITLTSINVPTFYYHTNHTMIYYIDEDRVTRYIHLHRDAVPIGEGVEVHENSQ